MNSAGPEALKSGGGSQEAKAMCHVHRVEKKKGKGEKQQEGLQGGECLEKTGKETPCKDREPGKGQEHHAVQAAARKPWTLPSTPDLPRPRHHGPKEEQASESLQDWGWEVTPFRQLLPPTYPTQDNMQGLSPGWSQAHRAPLSPTYAGLGGNSAPLLKLEAQGRGEKENIPKGREPAARPAIEAKQIYTHSTQGTPNHQPRSGQSRSNLNPHPVPDSSKLHPLRPPPHLPKHHLDLGFPSSDPLIRDWAAPLVLHKGHCSCIFTCTVKKA